MTNQRLVEFITGLVGHCPADLAQYSLAFVHPSLDGEKNYQRLEYLGDAVLTLAVSRMLFDRHPGKNEGDLTKERMALVRKEVLSQVSEKLGFKAHIRLGRSEESDLGREKESILSDVFEAFLGALYLECGVEGVIGWLDARMGLFEEAAGEMRDFKSALQELVQSRMRELPRYEVEREEGEAHRRTFHVGLYVGGLKVSEGAGTSKKAAEQNAAMKAYRAMSAEEP